MLEQTSILTREGPPKLKSSSHIRHLEQREYHSDSEFDETKHSITTSKTLDEDGLKLQLANLNLLRDISDGNLKSLENGESGANAVGSKLSLFEKKQNRSKTSNLRDSGDEKADEGKSIEKTSENIELGAPSIEEKPAVINLLDENANEGLSTPPEMNFVHEQSSDAQISLYKAINELVTVKFEDIVNKDDSQLPKSLDAKLNLEPQEKCLTSFACAFAQTILLQGRLYILSSKICFQSLFNKQTLFGETLLIIPISDIISIERRMNLIFHNSIAIITKNGELFFTSFIYRESAFNVLETLVNSHNKRPEELIIERKDLEKRRKLEIEQKREAKEAKEREKEKKKKQKKEQIDQEGNHPQTSSLQGGSSIINSEAQQGSQQQKEDPKTGEISSIKEESKADENSPEKPTKIDQNIISPETRARLEARKEKLLSQMVPLEGYKEAFTHKFTGVRARDIFDLFFSDKPSVKIIYKASEYPSFDTVFHREVGDTKIETTNWKPAPPGPFRKGVDSLDEMFDIEVFCERDKTYFHPPKEKGTFIPKVVTCNEKHRAFFLDESTFAVEIEVNFAKMPYADCFKVRKLYFARENNKDVEFESKFYVDFIKSTVFRSRIENSTADESRDIWLNKFLPVAVEIHREYLKFKSSVALADEMKLERQVNNQSSDQMIENNFSAKVPSSSELEEKLSRIYEEVKDVNTKLEKRVSELQTELIGMKTILLAILVLHFVFGLFFFGSRLFSR